MTKTTLTHDRLIQRIQFLENENKLLKEQKSDIAGIQNNSIVLNEVLLEKNRQWQFLANLAFKLTELPASENLPLFLIKQLKEFTGAGFIAYSEYNPDKSVLITKHIEASESILKHIVKIVGNQIINHTAPIVLNKQNYAEVVSSVVKISKSQTELSFGAIPKIVDSAIKKITGFDTFCGLSFVVSGELIGISTLWFKSDQLFPDRDLLVSFSHLASVSLQRRKTEIALLESESRYRMLIENQGEGVGIVDLNEVFVFVNSAAEKIFGKEPGGLIHRNLNEFVVPEHFPLMLEETEKRIKGESSTYEIDIINAAGEQRSLLVTATQRKDAEGIHIGTFGVFRDITDRKLIEVALQKSEEKFRSLIDGAPDAFFHGNSEGSFIGVNEQSCILTGYSREVLLRMNMTDLFSEEELKRSPLQYDLLLSGKTVLNERYLRRKDGLLVPIEMKSKKMHDSTFQSFMADLTFRKAMENELIKMKEMAEESDDLKTAFLQNMSHEIRTPMNAIIGFSELMIKPGLSKEKSLSFLSIIKDSSQQLLSIVNDILTISAIDTGMEQVSCQLVNINKILKDIEIIFKPLTEKKSVQLILEKTLSSEVADIITDEHKLIQILSNLISNAIKFTHKGCIEYGCSLKSSRVIEASEPSEVSEPVELVELEFYVKDSGIGIASELHDAIFERFRQADHSIARKYGGTGLGLAISKGLVELLGGSIRLESKPEYGTVFYFTIPIDQYIDEKNTKVKVAGMIEGNKKNILIAEDEENNFFLIEELIGESNHTIFRARNGQEAVEVFQKEKIDLVIMDLRMPVMNGYDATKIIKSINPDIPVIAQSAYALQAEIKKAMESGFDDYLTKPLNEHDFFKVMNKYW